MLTISQLCKLIFHSAFQWNEATIAVTSVFFSTVYCIQNLKILEAEQACLRHELQ